MKRRTLAWLIAILVAEAIVIVALPSRVPRPVRALNAFIDLAAAAALWLFLRQHRSGGR